MKLTRIVATLSTATVLVMISAQPVVAVHDTVDCDYDDGLTPLLQLIHNLTEVAYVVGAGLGVLSLAYAGIVYTWGSEDAKRRAKDRVQRVLVGVVILLSAPIIIGWLVSQLPVCGGA